MVVELDRYMFTVRAGDLIKTLIYILAKFW